MLHGVDISVYQGVVDFAKIKAGGVSFVIVKATESLAWIDPDFERDWEGAKAAGLVRGAYHFCRPEAGDPLGQARHFLATVGNIAVGDILALDLETPEQGGDESAFALACAQAVTQIAGFRPLLYCNQDWALHRLTDPALAVYPLWLASYTATCPASIGVWPSVALQQYSSTLSVPGIDGAVDGDELARTLDGLRALGKPPVNLRLTQAAALKPTPDHTSAAVVQLAAGAVVAPDGRQTTHWLHVHTSHWSGWLLKADLAPVL